MLITGGLVAVAVLLTIGGTLVWNVFSARAAEDAVDSAVEEGLTRWVKAAAGDAGQCVGMDDLIVSDGVSIEDDCEDMTGSVPDATVRRVNVGPVEFDGDRATAPVTMWGSYVPPPIGTGSENSTEQNVHGFQLRVRMIKHSGMWKIDWRD